MGRIKARLVSKLIMKGANQEGDIHIFWYYVDCERYIYFIHQNSLHNYAI